MKLLQVVGLLAALSTGVACSSRQTTVIAQNAHVGPTGLRVRPDSALQTPGYFNGVEFEIGPRGSEGAPAHGFRLEDGAAVRPAAEAVDEHGDRHALRETSHRFFDGRRFFALYARDLPKDAKVVAVVLRSDVSFSTPQVLWVSWDPK